MIGSKDKIVILAYFSWSINNQKLKKKLELEIIWGLIFIVQNTRSQNWYLYRPIFSTQTLMLKRQLSFYIACSLIVILKNDHTNQPTLVYYIDRWSFQSLFVHSNLLS
jgi:hypothetical protein